MILAFCLILTTNFSNKYQCISSCWLNFVLNSLRIKFTEAFVIILLHDNIFLLWQNLARLRYSIYFYSLYNGQLLNEYWIKIKFVAAYFTQSLFYTFLFIYPSCVIFLFYFELFALFLFLFCMTNFMLQVVFRYFTSFAHIVSLKNVHVFFFLQYYL